MDCTICQESYDDVNDARLPTLLLPCTHTFCKTDSQRLTRCPNCRVPIQSRLTNFALRDMIAQRKSELSDKDKDSGKCAECKKDLGSVFCFECSVRFCESCADRTHVKKTAHRRLPLDHAEVKQRCPNHMHKQLLLFCVKCDVTVCEQCSFDERHKTHAAAAFQPFPVVLARAAETAANGVAMMAALDQWHSSKCAAIRAHFHLERKQLPELAATLHKAVDAAIGALDTKGVAAEMEAVNELERLKCETLRQSDTWKRLQADCRPHLALAPTTSSASSSLSLSAASSSSSSSSMQCESVPPSSSLLSPSDLSTIYSTCIAAERAQHESLQAFQTVDTLVNLKCTVMQASAEKQTISMLTNAIRPFPFVPIARDVPSLSAVIAQRLESEGQFAAAVPYWQSAVDKKDDPSGQAECRLACRMFARGYNVQANTKRAQELWVKSAAQGYEFARAACTHFGIGAHAKDLAAATAILHKLAQQGDVDAMLEMSWRQMDGALVEKNVDEAVKCLRTCAEKGHADALDELGECYRTGQGVDKNPAEAFEYFRQAAQQNHASAIFHLGECYADGVGVAADMKVAMEFFQRSATCGNLAAAAHLGWIYQFGKYGICVDEKEALKWYLMAAENGHADSMKDVGFFYARGKGGLVRDERKAYDYYLRAAHAGSCGAQFNLAIFLLDGTGVEKNLPEGMKWLRRSVDGGLAHAQYHLGRWLLTGAYGLHRDAAAALPLLRRAAQSESREMKWSCALELGKVYARVGEYGTAEVEQDEKEAVKWLEIAAPERVEARELLEEIKRRQRGRPLEAEMDDGEDDKNKNAEGEEKKQNEPNKRQRLT